MIKVQDFARECGVTDRQVQRLIKKYETELTGHFDRKGPNGTWLDDVACQLLRSRMKQQPIVVGDAENYRRLDALEKENSDLKDKLIAAMEMVQKQQALLDEGKGAQLRLQAAEEQMQKTAADLATANQQLGAARQENQDLKVAKQQQAQDLAAARAEADQEHREASRLRAEVESFKTMNPLQRLFWKGAKE